MTDEKYTPQKHISLLAKDILDFLKANCIGKENAVKISAIVFRFETDRRTVELCSEELREAGIPLCSLVCPPYGWFLARNYTEMENWCRQIDHRFKKMSIHRSMAIQRLKAEAAREGIQLNLEFFKWPN
ncbi:MAG: hypothetical protein WC716_16545 [Chitinophagaceae bacterium]|jgi:hypothetical protein